MRVWLPREPLTLPRSQTKASNPRGGKTILHRTSLGFRSYPARGVPAGLLLKHSSLRAAWLACPRRAPSAGRSLQRCRFAAHAVCSRGLAPISRPRWASSLRVFAVPSLGQARPPKATARSPFELAGVSGRRQAQEQLPTMDRLN